AGVLERAFEKKILEGLPISSKELPKEVALFYKSNGLRIAGTKAKQAGGGRGIDWVERLLEYPILDGRHRIVNLVLAPYLVNVRGMEIEEAVKRISAYIEACKRVNPDTRINEQYIRYQCAYAKRKGMKVLSAKRARELLGDELMDRIEGKEVE
ncbi:MAG: DNA primase noncatalytic subunit PriX, partial [Candidatus Micrarchaeaceae archaeon]